MTCIKQDFSYQLDFFETKEQSLIKEIRQHFELVKESSNNVRKGIFARHNEILKKINDVSNRLELLEKHICLNKN